MLMAACVALFSGCLTGDEDSPDGDAPMTIAENDAAEGVAETAFQTLGSMLSVVADPDGSSPLRETSANYDPQVGQWTVVGNEAYDDPEATGAVTFTILINISAGGVPQQYPDDTTDLIDVVFGGTNAGNFHPDDRDFDIDYDFDADAALHAVRNGSIVTITGGGTLSGSTTTHLGSLSVPRTQDASWSYALSLDTSDPAACVTGTVTGTVNQHSFDGTLADGVSSWTLRRNGTVVVTGTGEYPCGDGAPAL
jgi:hypothetical protein